MFPIFGSLLCHNRLSCLAVVCGIIRDESWRGDEGGDPSSPGRKKSGLTARVNSRSEYATTGPPAASCSPVTCLPGSHDSKPTRTYTSDNDHRLSCLSSPVYLYKSCYVFASPGRLLLRSHTPGTALRTPCIPSVPLLRLLRLLGSGCGSLPLLGIGVMLPFNDWHDNPPGSE